MREKLHHDIKLSPNKCDEILNGLSFLEMSPGNILPGDKLNFYATTDGKELVYSDLIYYYGIVAQVDKFRDKYMVFFDLVPGEEIERRNKMKEKSRALHGSKETK